MKSAPTLKLYFSIILIIRHRSCLGELRAALLCPFLPWLFSAWSVNTGPVAVSSLPFIRRLFRDPFRRHLSLVICRSPLLSVAPSSLYLPQNMAGNPYPITQLLPNPHRRKSTLLTRKHQYVDDAPRLTPMFREVI